MMTSPSARSAIPPLFRILLGLAFSAGAGLPAGFAATPGKPRTPMAVAAAGSELIGAVYSWADNGNTLGTITFAADGSARTTWSGAIHYWKVEAGGDLIISAMGTTYVTRLKRDPATGIYNGGRDRTSGVQDGVRVVLQPTSPTTTKPPSTGPGPGAALDRTIWFATRGSWKDNFGEGKAYDASGIVVTGDEITLQADRTDQVAVLYRKPIIVPSGSTVILRRQVYVHAANRKFEACLTAFGVNDDDLSARKPPISECLFNVGYKNFDYETDQNFFALTDGRVYPPGPGKFAGGTAPTTSPLWDQWFDEEIRYNSRTGETVCLLNGKERLRLMARPLTQPKLKLMLHPYGWNTGHFVRIRNLTISTVPGKSGPEPSSDLRSRLLRTTYSWADNGSVLGTIVFSPDGSARATWSGETHYWKLEGADQLMISAMGTTYVVRLTYSPGDGSFSGARDRTSQVQDGVKTVLRPRTP